MKQVAGVSLAFELDFPMNSYSRFVSYTRDPIVTRWGKREHSVRAGFPSRLFFFKVPVQSTSVQNSLQRAVDAEKDNDCNLDVAGSAHLIEQ